MAFRSIMADPRFRRPAVVTFRRRRGGARKRFRKRRASRLARTGGFTGLELKFMNTERSTTTLTTSWAHYNDGTMQCLNGLVQNSTESGRIGRRVQIHSIHIRGFFNTLANLSNAVPQGSHLVRVLLVLDTQTNGAQGPANLIMDTTGAQDLFAFRNLEYTTRFKVLWDRQMMITSPQGAEGASASHYCALGLKGFKINKTFKTPIGVTYSDAGGTVAAVTDNSLHIIALVNSSVNPVTSISFVSRIRYTG